MLLIIVHRLLQSLLLPPLNAMLFMVVGCLLPCCYKRLRTALIWFGIIFLYIQATPLFSYQLSRAFEPAPLTQGALDDAQAIVVVGSGLNPRAYEYPTHIMVSDDTLARLGYVAYLVRDYSDKLIITSGGYTGTKQSEASVMRDTLITFFAVKNPIMIEDKSRDTDENAKFVAQILLDKHLQHIVLVTSAYHMRRTMMLFRKYGLDPVAAPTDFVTNDDANTNILALVPTAHALAVTARTLHEIIGYLVDSL